MYVPSRYAFATRGTAVPRTGDKDRVDVVPANQAIHVRQDQVQPRRRTPMSKRARLEVFQAQRFAQQRIVEQMDLTHAKVGRRPPVGIDLRQIPDGRSPGREWKERNSSQ